ncbi:MAG: glycosyltransferase [Clostridia bacterium]|nr:glycosyltransferase [Clostridia bacterium]
MKILMVTMAMDIGGAETHILELSRKLQKRGVDVTVASNGGAYEAELEKCGITHVKIPCHSKNPVHMRRAYKLLRELILREKYDVVHAHARIPAFLCAMLHKKHHFRFVTTAHWVFNPGFPYNILTRWGERSLAVSDDIKTYLVDNYGILPENVRVTINGIDLEKFSKETDYSDIAAEFSLGEGKTRIVYVSRMDTDRSYAAHKLIEITPALYEKFPDLEVVIVGGGNDYDNITSEAEAVNKSLGGRVVITTGSRTDINKFAASGDLFVGVSRAALEGMACEKPAIIAGNEGYIGIFDEDKLTVSIDTNFCCRGCEETTAEKLLRDVTAVLSATAEEKARLGAYSRETVRQHYSMDTMSDDALKLYISVIKRSLVNEVSIDELNDIDRYLKFNPMSPKKRTSDVMISGYYGFGNMGDDSILETIITKLKKEAPGIEICALTRYPRENEETFGVRCISRTNIFAIIREMRHSGVLISGGGSLFQDSTSSKSLKYYAFIVNLAKKMGMKTYVYSNGVGMIYSDKNKRLTAKTVSGADRVTVRDVSSFEELVSIGVDKSHIGLSADPAFMMETDKVSAEEVMKKYGISADKGYFVVSLRRFEGLQKAAYDENVLLENVLTSCAETAKKYSLRPVFVSMQPALDGEISYAACREMKEKHGVDDAASIAPANGRELLCVLGGDNTGHGAAFVCSMRLHTLIYACRAAVPVIGLSLDPKIDAFTASIKHSKLLNIKDFSAAEMTDAMAWAVENVDAVKAELTADSEGFKRLAEGDVSAVIELLGE